MGPLRLEYKIVDEKGISVLMSIELPLHLPCVYPRPWVYRKWKVVSTKDNQNRKEEK